MLVVRFGKIPDEYYVGYIFEPLPYDDLSDGDHTIGLDQKLSGQKSDSLAADHVTTLLRIREEYGIDALNALCSLVYTEARHSQ